MSRGYHKRLERNTRVIEHLEEVHGVRPQEPATDLAPEDAHAEATTDNAGGKHDKHEDAE